MAHNICIDIYLSMIHTHTYAVMCARRTRAQTHKTQNNYVCVFNIGCQQSRETNECKRRRLDINTWKETLSDFLANSDSYKSLRCDIICFTKITHNIERILDGNTDIVYCVTIQGRPVNKRPLSSVVKCVLPNLFFKGPHEARNP